VPVVACFVFCSIQQSNDDSDSGKVDADLEAARMTVAASRGKKSTSESNVLDDSVDENERAGVWVY
jgi:hypothetical protein